MSIRGPFKGGATPNLLVPALTGIPGLVVTPSDLVRANHLNVFIKSILSHKTPTLQSKFKLIYNGFRPKKGHFSIPFVLGLGIFFQKTARYIINTYRTLAETVVEC
jgi:hypothetical protein